MDELAMEIGRAARRVTTAVTLSLQPFLSAASISEAHDVLAESAFAINSPIWASARCLMSPSVQSSVSGLF